MNAVLLASAAVVAIVAVTAAAVQSTRLASTRADLTLATERVRTTERALAAARAETAEVRHDLSVAVGAMTRERDRAVAAEKRAGELHARIARDVRTARDAPTAPVLRDVLERLRGRP